MKQSPSKGPAVLCKNLQPPDDEKAFAVLEAPSEAASFEGHMDLGIEALRRENEKCLEAEVAKWHALVPEEEPFEWRGKPAAEILVWRNAKLRKLLERCAVARCAAGATPLQSALVGATACGPGCACLSHACEKVAKASPGSMGAGGLSSEKEAKQKTSYEEKLARWKRAILEEKIIDLDDAAFEEKFAEWHTHALRLESIQQEIIRLEKKAVELKIEELKEQAAKQQAELKQLTKKPA